MQHDEAKKLIRVQFEEGPLPKERAEELRQHQRQCEECKSYYDRLAELERAVEGSSKRQLERLRALGAPAEASEEESPPARVISIFSRLRGVLPLAATVLVVAGASALYLSRGDEITARGERESKGSWIAIYRASGEKSQRAEGRAKRGDALLFTYTNQKASAARYLLIAGRDSKGKVLWFHPAYTEAANPPESIAIESGVADKELRERVFADVAPGRFEICAVFTREPLRVGELDRALESGGKWPESGIKDCHVLEIEP